MSAPAPDPRPPVAEHGACRDGQDTRDRVALVRFSTDGAKQNSFSGRCLYPMSDWQRNTTPQHTHPAGDPGVLNFPTAVNTAPHHRHSEPVVCHGRRRRLARLRQRPPHKRARAVAATAPPRPASFPAARPSTWSARRRSSAAVCWTAYGPPAPAAGRPPCTAAASCSSPLRARPSGSPPARLGRVEGSVGTRRFRAIPRTGETFPPLLCHGLGDAVTVPALHRIPPAIRTTGRQNSPSRRPPAAPAGSWLRTSATPGCPAPRSFSGLSPPPRRSPHRSPPEARTAGRRPARPGRNRFSELRTVMLRSTTSPGAASSVG